jgi:two-component system NtrC family response regulator
VKGKIEQAHGGTLFLDEIGDMPTHLQSKLLRFLQERVIERVGGRSSISVDLRIVCATHRDIDTMIGGGEFREDLYYRLSEIRVHVPPLRERPGDAVLIARELLMEGAQRLGARKHLGPEAEAAIEGYRWPGNVRELVNRVKRATVLSEGATVTAADLDLGAPALDDPRRILPEAGTGAAGEPSDPGPISLRAARDAADKRVIAAALKRHNGNITQTAQELQISRPTLYNLMREHGVTATG